MSDRLRIGVLCHPTYGGSGVVAADDPGPILSQRAGGPDPMEGIDWILSATADSLC